jgi:hypothetical protein
MVSFHYFENLSPPRTPSSPKAKTQSALEKIDLNKSFPVLGVLGALGGEYISLLV